MSFVILHKAVLRESFTGGPRSLRSVLALVAHMSWQKLEVCIELYEQRDRASLVHAAWEEDSRTKDICSSEQDKAAWEQDVTVTFLQQLDAHDKEFFMVLHEAALQEMCSGCPRLRMILNCLARLSLEEINECIDLYEASMHRFV